jgi:predicted alpha/beta superfamily hydrolase
MKHLVSIVALLLGAHLASAATTEVKYESAAFAATRKVLIASPPDYDSDPSRRYPVLYVLNESANFEWAAGIAEFLAEREEIDELIVVGIPSDETYGRDNYPFAGPESLEANPWAERYESLIRDEVIPYVDRTFRTNGSRYVAGHSLSGLFVTGLFLRDPEGFDIHLAISPSYHQAPQIIDVMRDALIGSRIDAGALYVAVGDLEHSLMRRNVDKMVETLQAHAPNDVHWTHALLQHNNHRSTAGSGLSNGLSWMYRGWDPTEEMAASQTIDEIAAHYESFADFLGYRLVPREANTIGLARFLLGRLFEPAAALNAYRIALHFYSDSVVAKQMVLLLEPWLAGGTGALRQSLHGGAEIEDTTILELIDVLQNHGQADAADEVLHIAAAHYPDSSDIQRRLSAR